MKANFPVTQDVLRAPEHLAHIFSFLDLTSQKEARLVSRTWNQLVLAEPRKYYRLGVRGNIAHRDIVLNTVEEKLLRNIVVDFIAITVSEDTIFQRTLRHPRLNLYLAKLRILQLENIREEETIYSFIQLVNTGSFVGLENLQIQYSLCFNPMEENGVYIAAAGTLPKLKHLQIHHYKYSCPSDKSRAEMQSLIAASPNLLSLETNIFLDLSEYTHVKKLILKSGMLLEKEEQLLKMIVSAREFLVYLDLHCIYPQLQYLPQFPKLSSLRIFEDKFSFPTEKRTFRSTNFLALKRLRMPFPWIVWENFTSNGMEEIELLNVPLLKEEPLRLLLNASVARLKLHFAPFFCHDIEDLRTLPQLGDFEEQGVINPNNVLKMYGHGETQRIKPNKACELRHFSAILNKLCRRWRRILFSGFMFNSDPTWTEAEVPLLDGLKMCSIRIKKIGASWEVSCKIQN